MLVAVVDVAVVDVVVEVRTRDVNTKGRRDQVTLIASYTLIYICHGIIVDPLRQRFSKWVQSGVNHAYLDIH